MTCGGAFALMEKPPFTSMRRLIMPALHPDCDTGHLRFVQTRSKLDLMVFVANTFFPRQYPPEYKQMFKRGGCPRWLLDPRRADAEVLTDWLPPAAAWRYDVPNATIEYSGSEEAKEPQHPFPFNFFLPRRMSLRFALIKRDFFCQNTQIQSTMMLDGAKEAGLVFRAIGERNFWAVLLTLGGSIQLIRVRRGERINLGTVGTYTVQSRLLITLAEPFACAYTLLITDRRQMVHDQCAGVDWGHQSCCE